MKAMQQRKREIRIKGEAAMRQSLLGPRVSSMVGQNDRGEKVVRLE
jgi:hypothetical protein